MCDPNSYWPSDIDESEEWDRHNRELKELEAELEEQGGSSEYRKEVWRP